MSRPAQEQRGSKRSAEEAWVQPEGNSGGGGSAPGSGKSKPKGKGKGKQSKTEDIKKASPRAAYKMIRNAPSRYGVSFKGADGKARCHNFQAGLCTSSSCQYAHVCVRCGGAHGASRCPELGLDKQ